MAGSDNPRPRIAAAAFFAVIVPALIFAGCNKNYGRFTLDARVDQAFRAGEVQPEMQYYYAGRETMPYVIIAVDRGYTVPSRYWIPFAPEPEQLRNMSWNIYGKDRYQPYGARILSPDGAVIGAWYSGIPNRSVHVDPAERTVSVLFKNPENSNYP